MSHQPRPYQREAADCGIEFFNHKKDENGIIIAPTASGKSLIIAHIAMDQHEGKTIVFQPSKEILEQNFSKYTAYGFRAGIYSASAGHKYLDKVVFATIGSVINKLHLFKDYTRIIIDECHEVNSNGGMYQKFINSIPGAKVVGLTATPYRLASTMYGAELRFLTHTNPRIFNKVLYSIQTSTLFEAGYLAPLKYYSFDVIDRRMLQMNSNGSDFTDASLRSLYKKVNMPQQTINYANRLLKVRNNLLVFCSLVSEAETVAKGIPGAVVVHGETPPKLRDQILASFKAGKIKCVVNVGVLTTGFDYPELECVLLARSTMSLALYYQIVGRVMRPFTYDDGTKKEGWIVDLGGNIKFFGKIETLKIERDAKGKYFVSNNGRQLTNVPFVKN